MRVGIYNRWLATLGGGEQYSLAIAEYLSREHDVDVITHKPVLKQTAEERLNVDLSKVTFLTIPDCHPVEVGQVSANYDLFINASYVDVFPCFAKWGMAVVYFPVEFGRRVALKRWLKHTARQWLKLPAVLAGFHAFEAGKDSFRWKTDTVIKVQLSSNPTPYQVSFELSALEPGVTGAELLINEQVVGRFQFDGVGVPAACELTVPKSSSIEAPELLIRASGNILSDGQPKMVLASFRSSLPQYRLYQLLFERIWRGGGSRLQFYPLTTSMFDYLDSYDVIVGISEFTQRWIRRYWRRDSELLYPAVHVENFKPAEKLNRILNVGRFFAGSHNKKHIEMINTFKHMVDRGLKDWEFHLAGGKMSGKEHEDYLSEVYVAAQGYPVYIHPGIPFQELVQLYESSSIYWHASGYGEDERKEPAKFEHFGITTVEAMAAGCVPVVIKKGGQPEIVRHEQNGFLWNSLEELQAQTLRIINDPALRLRLSEAAIRDSVQYDQQHFYERLASLLVQIGFPG